MWLVCRQNKKLFKDPFVSVNLTRAHQAYSVIWACLTYSFTEGFLFPLVRSFVDYFTVYQRIFSS